MIYLLGGAPTFSAALADSFRENLKSAKHIVFIPTSSEAIEKTQYYKDLIMQQFTDIGLIFDSTELLMESTSIEWARGCIGKADIVYLMGGNPLTQMDFIKRKGIDTVLKSDTKTLIGFSAGAINISEHAIVIQDDSVDESTVYDGLNLTGGISVDVHYTEVKDADIREVQAKWAIETIYAIPENSGILIHGDDIKFIGTEPVVRF